MQQRSTIYGSLHELPLPRMFVISTDDFLDLSEMRFVWYVGGRVTAWRRMWLSLVMLEVGSLSVCLLFGMQSKPAVPCLSLRACSELSLFNHINHSKSIRQGNIHLSSMYLYWPKRLQVLCVSFQTCRLFEATSRIVGWEIGPSLSACINRPCYPEKP